MKYQSQLKTVVRSRRRNRAGKLAATLASLAGGTLLVVGCGPAPEVAPEPAPLTPPSTMTAPSMLSAPGLAKLPPVPESLAGSVPRQRTRLVTFAGDTAPISLDFGGFESGKDSAGDRSVKLVQAPALPAVPEGFDADEALAGGEDEAVGPSASDLGPVEVIPTPPAQPEVKAEIIPTPQGIPEGSTPESPPPVARIAADLEKAIGEAMKSGDSIKAPGKPVLIDPETEIGLVGTQEGPEEFQKWEQPDAVLFITGDQHGYIEPCGCTGLDKQKGGVARRFTFMDQLRRKDWPLIPIDAGNQIRRIGQQAAIKFSWSCEALKQMKYQAVGFGPADMRLSVGDLIQASFAESPDEAMFVAGNVVLVDPSFVPSHKIVRQGDWTIGLTSLLDPESLSAPVESDVMISPLKESAEKVLAEMNAAGATFRVVTFYGEETTAKKLMAEVPGFDLIVVSGGYGEPTYRPQSIPDSETKLIVTGNKGMYAGLVALYEAQPMKYARVPLSHEYEDAPEMRELMKQYQKQLEGVELSGLGISPIPHPSGEKFVGSERCGKCHTTAKDIWDGSDHALATEHIVKPPKERGDIARHFDPECISCHVTGWNAQNYYPYETGYLNLEDSSHLVGNGCENCHGPGLAHSDAEEPNSGVADDVKERLRKAMQLPLEKAREHCMQCHDLDNSPDFHEEDAFEDEYWPMVEHYGVD